MNTYPFSIVTPAGIIFNEHIESVVVPGTEGSFGVLKSHAPIVSTLAKGIVRVKKENNEKYFVINAGVLEVDQEGQCLLLSDQAQQVQTHDEARAKLVEINV